MLIARLGNVLIARLVILCIMHALKNCAYGTSKILCIMHLKNIVLMAPQKKYFVPMAPQKYCAYCTSKIFCAYGTSKNFVPMAPQRTFVPIAPQRLCAYGTLKTFCLQLCRLLPLLHLQQKIFFLQGHWRRRGRLRWQGRQNSHRACRQCWPRKELGSPSRRQRRQLSSG